MKVKLCNPQKFNVGVKTLDRPDGYNIASGSFILVEQDDIAYITSICTLIQRGILRIENTAGAKEDVARDIIDSLGIDLDKDPNFAADEDIKKHLSGSAKKIGEWMDTIVEPSVRDRIFDIAMEMNLPMNKIQVLQEKMPDHTFIGD